MIVEVDQDETRRVTVEMTPEVAVDMGIGVPGAAAANIEITPEDAAMNAETVPEEAVATVVVENQSDCTSQ